ncbi:alpha/beta hydrolase [Dokdonia sp. Hel_I_53]|uniref:alpha/beta hydrolase n=1 Tax=Dokdonia sp. Hel_I_53 TaxID=1566287 RepID=UPI00119C77D2|nr:alpha/beta hydrolase-fold protein [Dokdonia sp. Hel_I_53]TVZ53216.1 hypothetical protein OD90_2416 [Dokdonia sp. Hel_I_53]
MKKIVLLLLLCISTKGFAQNTLEINGKRDFSIGEIVTVHSEILQEERALNIYLPKGYNDSGDKKYPVIYLLDGSLEEDIIHIAGLVQFCSFSWINIIPESIVVGISNIDRKRDFTFPTKNKQDKADFPTAGGSDKFIKFIERELQPTIIENYRVSETSTIIGQSLGGLLTTEVLLTRPSLFTNYIIISPSLWWDDESLLTRPIQELKLPGSVYVGVGKEGEIMERTAKGLFEKILKYSSTEKIHFNSFEKQTHGDALHLAVYDAFEKIFNKNQN